MPLPRLRRRHALGLAAAAAVGGAWAGPAPAAPRPPTIEQLVVFKSGKAFQARVRAPATTVKVGRHRCGVARATPLAALLRSRPGRIGVEDFGACSARAADSGQLYVRSIRRDRERGAGGWVYKVGRKLGTAGAGDPAGPFGRGRLHKGSRVTWFYCVLRRGSCQRTLVLRVAKAPDGALAVIVRAYDDEGRGEPVPGAAVSGGGVIGITDAGGAAHLALPPGRHRITATKSGFVRSFAERVSVG